MMWWLDRARKACARGECCFWSIGRPLAVVRSRKGRPIRGKCILQDANQRQRGREECAVARKKQQLLRKDENERCEHHQDDPFEYPAHPSDRSQEDEIERWPSTTRTSPLSILPSI